jgi:RNA polymerase sigma-70 factor (ECF subfamily)
MKNERGLTGGGGLDRDFLAGQLESWRERIFLICLGYTRNCIEAEELAQDVLCRAWERPGTFQDAEHFGRWIVVVTRNRCREHFRTARLRGLLLARNRPPAPTPETPEDRALRDEAARSVKKAVAALPEKLRSVLVLREYGELSYQEIAAALRIDVGTVMSRLSRARHNVLLRAGMAKESRT